MDQQKWCQPKYLCQFVEDDAAIWNNIVWTCFVLFVLNIHAWIQLATRQFYDAGFLLGS